MQSPHQFHTSNGSALSLYGYAYLRALYGLLTCRQTPVSDSAANRYSRQTRFAPFGPEGQERLGRSTAVIVGCGALGTVQATLLARAGVGTLRLVDRDYVEMSNLQRQVLYTEADAEAAMPKAEAARRHLLAANSDVNIEAHISDLDAANADELLGGAAVILDGTDNFETRMLINDFAVRERIPWIYGAAVSSYGIAMPVLPGETACFRCVYPDVPTGAQPTCETAGVLGPVTSVIGSIQAMEALKILAGRTANVRRKILTRIFGQGLCAKSPCLPATRIARRADAANSSIWKISGARR